MIDVVACVWNCDFNKRVFGLFFFDFVIEVTW